MSARAVIVYWGPGLSGKSTNLAVVRGVVSADRERGAGSRLAAERASILSEFDEGPECVDGIDRTEILLGADGEEGLHVELLAPPGQAHHRDLQRLALRAVDGVVFVADSSSGAVAANLAALEELELLIGAGGGDLDELPLVFQYNKRDLRDALSIARLEELLNRGGRSSVEAIARRGAGVFPALKAVVGELQRKSNLAASGSGVSRPDTAASASGDGGWMPAALGIQRVNAASEAPSAEKLHMRSARLVARRLPGSAWLLALAVLGGALSRELIGLVAWLVVADS